MRVLVSSVVLSAVLSVLAFAFTTLPAQAQAYDPRYPVCMKLYRGPDGGEFIDCSYTSLPQCKATASGLAAMCDVNPYFAPAPMLAPVRRRHRHVYR